MTYVSLFAGAGGFDLGFDAAGFACAAQVEIDRTCRDVLARHWPGVPRFPDVRAFGKEQVPYADVVVGGFPCQDVSVAGKRGGFEAGERSSLWFEMVRVIRELRPLSVVWENVPGLLSADEGRAFGWVLRELADLGFDGGWGDFDARWFGVPQSRQRVFGVFFRGGAGAERAGQVLALAPGLRRHPPAGGEAGAGTPAAPRSGVAAAGGFACFGSGASGERTVSGSLTAHGGPCGRQDFESETFVVFNPQAAGNQTTLGTRADGLTGTQGACQVPAVVYHEVVPIDMRQASRGETMTNNRKPGSSGGAPGTGIGKPGDPCPTLGLSHTPAVAYTVHGEHSGAMTGNGAAAVAFPAKTARALDSTGGYATNQGGTVVVGGSLTAADATPKGRQDGLAYCLEARAGRGHGQGQAVCVTGSVTHTLTGEGHDASEDGTGRGTPIVTQPLYYSHDYNQDRVYSGDGITPALTAADSNRTRNHLVPGAGGYIVRRLTPTECERLMGWPDGHTKYRADGRVIADGPRYRMCGNGVVGTVSKWLAARLMAAMTGGGA